MGRGVLRNIPLPHLQHTNMEVLAPNNSNNHQPLPVCIPMPVICSLPTHQFGRMAVWNVGTGGDLDTAKNPTMITMLPYYLIAKIIATGSVFGALFSIVDGQGFWYSLLAGALGGMFSLLIAIIKISWDAIKKRKASNLSLLRTTTTAHLEQEKISDKRLERLIDEMQEFYSIQLKEKDATIGIAKALSEQKDVIIEQLKDLVVKQAAAISKLERLKLSE